MSEYLFKDILLETKDGEWGKGEPGEDLVRMKVIRGTDFEAVRNFRLDDAPERFIPRHIAERKSLKPYDILLETAGGTKDQPTGRSVILNPELFKKTDLPITCASFSRFLRVNSDIANPEYIFWWLQYMYESRRIEVFHVQHTGVARFQYTLFATTTNINLPPDEEQSEVVRTLSCLDKKIELNQRMNATLESIAKALFKSWFVDFDPVKAKAEGRKPEGMDDVASTLFPSSFSESALGLIPEGWKPSSVGECFKLIMGQSPPGETYNEFGEGIAFYQGRRDFGWRFPLKRIYCNAPTRFAEQDDTLVSVRAPVGDINMAWDRCCIGRGVAALRHNSGASSFTYYATQQLQTHFKSFDGEGTVFGSINKADFAKLPHIEPSDKVIQLYEAIASSLDKRIKTNEDQIRTLTEVRDNLLPRLISGKLQVSEISKTVEALAL